MSSRDMEASVVAEEKTATTSPNEAVENASYMPDSASSGDPAHESKPGPMPNEDALSATVSREQYQLLLDKIAPLESKFNDLNRLTQWDRDGNEWWMARDDSDLESDLEMLRATWRLLLSHFQMSHELKRRKSGRQAKEEEEKARERESKADKVTSLELVTTLLGSGAKGELSYLDWKSFRRKDHTPKHVLLTPIEVLVGEPELDPAWDSHNYHGDSNTLPEKGAQDAMKALAKDIRDSGRGSLPERLRISSKSLVAILSKVYGSELKCKDDEVIILRPFKILACYESRLRDWANKLERKFETQPRSKPVNGSSGTDGSSSGQPAAEPNPSASELEVSPNQAVVSSNADDQDRPKEDDELPDDELTSPKALLHIRCLIDFIDAHIHPKAEYLQQDECQTVLFNDLWFLFKPGDEVIGQGERQAYRVIRVTTPVHKVIPPWVRWQKKAGEEIEKPFTIHCVYIDFDGKQLGPVSKSFPITRYDGERQIKALPVYPLRFCKKKDMRTHLIERGQKLLKVASVMPMYYMGFTLDGRDEVDSQVVVDFNEALADPDNKAWAPTIEPVDPSVESKEEEASCNAVCCRFFAVHDDAQVDEQLGVDYTLQEINSGKNPISDNEYAIMSYRVFAFVLRSRKWAQLDITYLTYENKKENANVKRAFDSLVLPDGHKDMVQALVTQHFADKDVSLHREEQSDLIRGKGKGLIMLLHGAPGVGKTTTAEGIAEEFKKPLFQITCGDLGTTANEVQTELEWNFSLASRWGCILLLDEADVFLAQRERKDFKRNGLVAVFLRVLEYYAGILFLTTNRVGDFDEAFASRIHMSLFYPELDLQKTQRIFEVNLELMSNRFVERDETLRFDQSAILDFAKGHFETHPSGRWNGRQVRNACQTALALAEYERTRKSTTDGRGDTDVCLDLKHFRTVQTAYLDFSRYLGEIFGTARDERALDNQFRAREEREDASRSKISERAAKQAYSAYNRHGVVEHDIPRVNQRYDDIFRQGSQYSQYPNPSYSSSHAGQAMHHYDTGPYPPAAASLSTPRMPRGVTSAEGGRYTGEHMYQRQEGQVTRVPPPAVDATQMHDPMPYERQAGYQGYGHPSPDPRSMHGGQTESWEPLPRG